MVKKRLFRILHFLLFVVIMALSLPSQVLAAGMSDWVTAADVPAGAEILDRKWEYTLTTYIDSTNSSMPGYTQSSSEWVQTGTGSAYYASFPTGYDAGNYYYTNFMHSPYSAYENSTAKRVVSNSWSGYIYWHWMYNCGSANAYYRTIYDHRGTASYNGFAYKYFGAFASSSGYTAAGGTSYSCGTYGYPTYWKTGRTSYADSQGTYFWYRFDYYTSRYTDYTKLFHYVKTEDKESTVKVTEGTSTSGSTKTVISNVQELVRYQNSYTVTFDANTGENAPASQTKTYGKALILPTEVPEKDLFMFKGWALSRDADEPDYEAGDSFETDADTTLYAVWDYPSGECGSSAEWLFKDDTLFINGSGALFNYENSTLVPWSAYAGIVKSICIADTITTIPDYAFLNCSKVETVTLPASVTTVGQSAFQGCTALTDAVLSENLEFIGESAFMGDACLKNISIPQTVKSIGAYAFQNCKSLPSLALPESLTALGEHAFEGCESLEEIALPKKLESLPAYLLANAVSLKNIAIPSGVKTIGEFAFSDCGSIKNLIVPDSVTEIERGAFRNCAGMETITIPDSVEAIGTQIFAGISDSLTVRCYIDTTIYSYAKEAGISIELMSWGKLEPVQFSSINEYGGVYVKMSAVRGTIHYTLDGSQPTEESPVYTTPVLINSNHITIQAIAMQDGWDDSEANAYEVVLEMTEKPYASQRSGSRLKPGTMIELYCDTPDSEIWYTTDGSRPTSTDVYKGPFAVDEDIEVYAVAISKGRLDSKQAYYEYEIIDVNEVPVITTNEATNITDTSAKLSAEVDDTAQFVQFVYYEKNNSKVKYTIEADKNHSATLTGLSPATEYWFQARAVNDAGWNTGYICSFVTDYAESAKPTSIELDPTYVTMNVGKTKTILPTVLPITADCRDVYWSSEDPRVATVDASGTITATGLGNTRIKATTVANRLVAYCSVDVVSTEIAGDFNFSESNMMTNSSNYDPYGYDHGVNDGGNALMASAYLARWDGAVLESKDPYPSSIADVKYKEIDADYHVQNILYLPYRQNSLDNNEIKSAVMKYGAVYTALRINYAYFSDAQTNYYLPPNVNKDNGGHAIVIVGWDDNYPRSAFSVAPEGNGAFICKNSWGTSSGEDGYFYVSYYDKHIARANCGDFNAVFYDLQNAENYNKIYQYDYLGPVVTRDLGCKNAYISNVFPESGSALAESETLKAVSLYNYTPGTAYEIYVVKDYTAKESLKNLGSAVAMGTLDYAGYFTVNLDNPIQLKAGTRFAVVVKYLSKSYSTKVFLELPTTIGSGGKQVNHSSNARANADESYFSDNGRIWNDMTDFAENANVCVKAFTETSSDSDILLSGIDNLGREYTSDKVYTPEEIRALGMEINADDSDVISLEEDVTESFGFMEPSILPDLNTNHNYSEGCELPERYDLRVEGCMTPVRDQGLIGSCWTFATYASLESSVKKSSMSAGNVSADGLSQSGGAATLILLDHEELTLTVGSQTQIVATVFPHATSSTIVWRSSDPSVAAVSAHGLITATGTGNAEITATTADGNVQATCTVVVKRAASIQSIAITNTEKELEVGKQLMLEYSVLPGTVDADDLIWQTDQEEIASINEYGVLTAHHNGVVTVHVSSQNGEAETTYQVRVLGGSPVQATSMEKHLTEDETSVSGSVDVEVANYEDNVVTTTVIMGMYSAQGKLLSTQIQKLPLNPGKNVVSFSDIMVQKTSSEAVTVKVFVVDELCYVPLTAVLPS